MAKSDILLGTESFSCDLRVTFPVPACLSGPFPAGCLGGEDRGSAVYPLKVSLVTMAEDRSGCASCGLKMGVGLTPPSPLAFGSSVFCICHLVPSEW